MGCCLSYITSFWKPVLPVPTIIPYLTLEQRHDIALKRINALNKKESNFRKRTSTHVASRWQSKEKKENYTRVRDWCS